MKQTFLLLIFFLLLAGCTTVFTHPTKTGQDFDRDRKECAVYAQRELVAKGMPET